VTALGPRLQAGVGNAAWGFDHQGSRTVSRDGGTLKLRYVGVGGTAVMWVVEELA